MKGTIQLTDNWKKDLVLMPEIGSYAWAIMVAKAMTENYAKTHKGRNKLEKECIKKGFLIKRTKEVFPTYQGKDRDKFRVFGLRTPIPRTGKAKSNFIILK